MDFFYNFNGNIPNHYYMPLFVQSQQPIGVNNPLIMQFPVIPPPPFPMTIQYQSPSQHEQRQSDENMFPIIINIDENPKTGNEKIGSKWYGYKKGKCAMCKSAADILLRPPKMNEIYKEAYEYQFDQYNLFTTSKFSLFNNFDKNENSASAFLFAKNKRFSTYSNLESFDESSLDFSNLKDFGTLKDVEMQLDMNNNHNQQENEKKPASIIAWKKPIIIDPSTSPCYDKVFPSLEQDSKKTNVNHCVFCKNNNEPPETFMSHTVKDSFGNTTCPILRRYKCNFCQATGDQAHTRSHCPQLLKIKKLAQKLL